MEGKASEPLQFLAPGYRGRLLAYRKILAETGDEMLPIWDLSQNASVRKNFTDLMPSPLTRSLFWSEMAKRELLPQELMYAMGWMVPDLLSFAPERIRPVFPFPDSLFQDLPLSVILRLLGNSVHCRVAGLLLTFAISVTAKVQKEANEEPVEVHLID